MNYEAENNLSYIASELYHSAQGFEDFPKKLQPVKSHRGRALPRKRRFDGGFLK